MTAGHDRILLFIPMYNCRRQIPRVLAQLTPEVCQHLSEVLIVDNRSQDGSPEAAKQSLEKLPPLPVKILLNDRNVGLGGSHKVAFNYCLENGFDYCIVLHGDDQGSIGDLVPLLKDHTHKRYDWLLGSRFMKGSRLDGYSWLRTWGNRAFNRMFSVLAGSPIYDLGSGLNMYAVQSLRGRSYLKHPDDLTFNYHMILHGALGPDTILFFPLLWREADQISNVRLFRQSTRLLGILFDFAFRRNYFLAADNARPGETYISSLYYERPGGPP